MYNDVTCNGSYQSRIRVQIFKFISKNLCETFLKVPYIFPFIALPKIS